MRALILLTLAALALAGCSDSKPAATDALDIDVQPGLGAVVGVVVDNAIVPIEGAKIVLKTDPPRESTTDVEGRFTFVDVRPGPVFVEASKPGYASAQASMEVVADATAPVLKIQLARLFDQEPFSEVLKFDGFLTCSYHAVLVTAPCITDYTSIVYPGGLAPQLREVQGDSRSYTTPIGAGWQQIVLEMAWESSAQGTSEQLGITVSHSQRLASHWFASGGGPSPFRLEINTGVPGPDPQGDPSSVPPEGLPDLYVFMNVQEPDGEYVALALNQEFELFQHTFYYGVPPEGWSFLNGDAVPF